MDLLTILGFLVGVYIAFGIMMIRKQIDDIKDEAVARGIPSWYAFTRRVLMWLPDRVLTKKG